MNKLWLLLITIIIMFTMTACTIPERPVEEPEEHNFITTCIPLDSFVFYEASVDAVIGTKDVIMMVTPDGDVEIPTEIYESAMEFQWEALCYRTDNGVMDKYVSARKNTNIPEPIIEYVEVPGETIYIPGETIYTHSVIDSDFIAEDGIFYFYGGEDIINLFYKDGIEIYILNLLYDSNIINTDQARIASITYFNGVFIGTKEIHTEWIDASVRLQDDTVLVFDDIIEMVEFMVANYSFDEVAADYINLEPGNDPNFWADENTGE